MRDTRNDGTTFYTLQDGSPEWMHAAMREAHDSADILPDNWIFDKADSIAARMADTDPDTWEDSVGEWADDMVDVYNNERARWLASALAYGAMVNEAVEELGGHSNQGIYGDIGFGQYRMLEIIASALIRAVNDEADEQEAEQDDA